MGAIMKQLLQILSILVLFTGVAIAQPTITSVSPNRNAIDVSVTSNIVITFDDDMDESTAESSDYIQVKGSFSGLLATTNTLSGDGLTLTIDPDSSFIPGETITVRIGQILDFTQTTGLQHSTLYQFDVETNGTGVGYFTSTNKFTGSIGDNSANMTYMADIDGDGDLDAVVVTRTASDLKFYVLYKENNSDSYLAPNLSRTYDIFNTANPQGATFNDVDNDGDLDFILFINPGANTRSFLVYTNNGSGSFSSTSHFNHSDLPTTSIGGGIFSDIDRDGLDELYIMADNVYGLWPFENDGTGGPDSFTEGASVGSYGSIAGRAAVSRDFNNDDYPDFAIIKQVNFSSSPTNDSLGVLLSDGSGGFTSHTYTFGVEGSSFDSPWGMDAGDFDGDGYIDIAINTSDSLFIFGNDQDGTFTPRGYDIPSSTRNVKAADMDNDGDLDIAILSSYSTIVYNDGAGNFTDSFSFSRGFSGLIPALGDADGDGDLDIVYSVNGTMTVLKNDVVTAPSTNPTSIVLNSNQGTSLGFSMNGGFGTKALVLMKEGAAVDVTPTDDVNYTANSTFGSGSEIGTGNYVVYDGTSTSFTVDGLTPNTTYHVEVFQFNAAGPFVKYQTADVTTTSGTTRTAPNDIVSDLSTSKLSTSMTLNWSASGSSIGTGRIVLMKQGSAVDATPTDSTSYTADASFQSGTQLGTGNYIVYDGSGTSVKVTGLTAETTYHFAIFEYDGTNPNQRFYTGESATISAITTPTPTIWSKDDSTLIFTKSDYADWTQSANQDRITDNLWLTRQDNRGLFNYADEVEYDSDISPSGTQWALGTTAGLDTLTFGTWADIHDGSPPDLVGEDMVMYIQGDNLYLDINFSSWTESDAGGGFSYTRSKGPEPVGISQTFQDSAGFAVKFDGGNNFEEYIEIYIEDYAVGTSFTTELWVRPDSIDRDQVFLALDSDDLVIGLNSSNQFYAIHTEPEAGGEGGGCCELKVNSQNNSGLQTVISTAEIDGSGTSITATAGEWYHIALSGESGGLMTLYVNGVEQDTASIENVNIDDSYWTVGSDEDRSKNFFGTVDELRIWKTVRTETQIRSFMHRPFEGLIGRLTGYWQFNEGSGEYTYDGLNNYEGEFYDGVEEAWVTSDVPIGEGTVEETSDFQTGTTNIGNAALSMADGFDNPVDIQVTEVSGNPNQFPTGFTSGLGGKYFVINLFGDPGTFSASLTLTYGSGVVTAAQQSNPSLLKLYKRGSNSTGEWTEIASASSANSTTGVVTWNGITAFSQFMGVAEEPSFNIQITDGTNIVSYNDSTYTFESTLFDLEDGFGDSLLTINSKSTLTGTLYLDQNSNGVYDSGTDSLLTADKELSYTPSGSIKLRYNSSTSGRETAVLKLQHSVGVDSVSLNFYTVEGDPVIAGNTGENGWYLLSNPFTTTIGDLLSSVWTQGAVNSDAPSGDATMYTFSEDSSKYVAITTDIDTTKLAAGQGLLVYLYADDDLGDGQDDIDGGWPKTLNNYGNPFGTDVSITAKNVNHDGVEGTTGSEGFALLGNPYGWSLSADSVISTLKREDALANSYVYRWNAVEKTYQILASGSINPYESVFVRVITSGTTANLSFDYDDAVGVLAKSKKPEMFDLNLVHLETERSSTFNLRNTNTAKAGIDPYDGYYLGSYANTYSNLYSVVDGQALSINNLPLGFNEEIEIPLYADATLDGDFVLNWDSKTLPEEWTVTLENNSTGEIVAMNETSAYSFTMNSSKKSVPVFSNKIFTTENNLGKGKTNNTPVLTLKVVSSVSVGTENDLGIPEVVELYQNYPNPFNPSSVIRFGVPTQSKVKLEVFDILGRRVATLLNNEIKPAGRYNVTFSANNLASGMYLYRLSVGNKVIVKKMTFIK